MQVALQYSIEQCSKVSRQDEPRMLPRRCRRPAALPWRFCSDHVVLAHYIFLYLIGRERETAAHCAGPYPPCEGEAMKIGDASKCKQTEEEIRQSMHEAKEMCFSQIQECGILSV